MYNQNSISWRESVKEGLYLVQCRRGSRSVSSCSVVWGRRRRGRKPVVRKWRSFGRRRRQGGGVLARPPLTALAARVKLADGKEWLKVVGTWTGTRLRSVWRSACGTYWQTTPLPLLTCDWRLQALRRCRSPPSCILWHTSRSWAVTLSMYLIARLQVSSLCHRHRLRGCFGPEQLWGKLRRCWKPMIFVSVLRFSLLVYMQCAIFWYGCHTILWHVFFAQWSRLLNRSFCENYFVNMHKHCSHQKHILAHNAQNVVWRRLRPDPPAELKHFPSP